MSAEVRRTKSKRVEKKGRFTITEIIPGSPSSPKPAQELDYDDAALGDGSPGRPQATTTPSGDEPTTTGSSPTNVAAAANATSISGAAGSPAADDMTTQSAPPGQSSSPNDPPEIPQAIAVPAESRRIKRKGRFTIIDLASDSSSSRRNSEDLKEERFANTTTISMSASDVTHNQQLSSSQTSIASGMTGKSSADKQRITRQARDRRTSSSSSSSMRDHLQVVRMGRSRSMRSESPVRKPLDLATAEAEAMQAACHRPAARAQGTSHGSVDSRRKGMSYGSLQTHLHHNPNNLLTYPELGYDVPSPQHSPQGDGGHGQTAQTTVVPHQSSHTQAAPSAAATNGYFGGPDPHQQPQPLASPGNGHQKTMLISAAQFLQQQQTIASLIRQQHDLKQLVAVLQEQQQQLQAIPGQLNDLKAETGDNRDEAMREVCMQLDTCMRSNDSLQAMLHNSEIEARERAIEIQQLAEENLMLRRRCDQIEGKYLEERKHSLALEQQLYHLHTMSIQSRAQDTISIGSHSRSPSTQDLASFEPNQTLYQAQSSMDFSTEGQR